MNRTSRAPVRVVIVDDSPAIRRSLQLAIDAHPELVVVGVGRDGVEGVDAVRAHDPDVVLIDFKMPRMDGILATREIRTTHPATRVVMLSAYDDKSIILHATDAGVDDFLCKGVPARVLHASLLVARRAQDLTRRA
jgi:DNA-binding NarL/FixJ family response regulator